MELFRLLGSNYAELTTEQLEELLSEWRTVIARLADRDAELTEDLNDEQILAAAQEGTNAVLEVQGIVDQRTEAAEQTSAQLRDLATQAGAVSDEEDGETQPGDGDGEQTGDGEGEQTGDAEQAGDGEQDGQDGDGEQTGDGEETGDGEGDAEEALAASGARRRRMPARVGQRNQPQPDETPNRGGLQARLQLLSPIPGMQVGQEISKPEQIVTAFREGFDSIHGSIADGSRVPIVRARVEYPQDRRVDRRNTADENTAVLDRFRRQEKREALVAAGGLCAPYTPVYDLMNIATADWPVADSLSSFNATRGGITFAPPMGIADLDPNTTGVITEEEDAAGGTSSVKTKGYIDCPDFVSVAVSAVYNRLGFHNMSARAWPEQVQQAIELAAAQHSRTAEVQLLDRMVEEADHVTAGQVVGAVADLMAHLIRVAVQYRSAQRMSPDAVLDTWFPAWVPDLLLDDVFHSQFYRFDFDRTSIAAELRKANINVAAWYIDSPTGLNQTYAKPVDGAALPQLKKTIEWFLAPRDTLHLLDAGTLDFGLVRDSTLNEVNEYEIFSENFQNLYFNGHQLLRITSTLCPNGDTGGDQVSITCP